MGSNSLRSDNKKDVKTAIFDAACEVIRDKGFHQARVTDIARLAGISYGLVYHYFGSKADLFDAIVSEWWGGLYARMDEYDERDVSALDKLTAILDHFLSVYETRPELVHIFITEISRSSVNLTQDRLDFFKRFFDRTEKIMEQGRQEGLLRSDIRARYLTYIFVGSLEGFISAMVLGNQPLKGKDRKTRVSDALIDVFIHGAKARI